MSGLRFVVPARAEPPLGPIIGRLPDPAIDLDRFAPASCASSS